MRNGENSRAEAPYKWSTRGTGLMLIALSALLSACTPSLNTQSVATFATATESLATSSKNAYDQVSDAVVMRNIYDAASNPKSDVREDVFAPLVAPNDEQTSKNLQLRFQLLDQLGAYAGALKDLVSFDIATGIDNASTDLAGALVGLRTTYKNTSGKELPLSADDLGLIATAVDTLGKEIAEEKRRRAVATIVEKANPAVQDTANLIAKEFGADSGMKVLARESVSNAYGSMRIAYLRERSTMSFEERLAFLQRLNDLHQAVGSTDAFFDDVSKGASAIGVAHGKLLAVVQGKAVDLSTTAGLAAAIGDLKQRADSARDFYKKLKAANAAAATPAP